MRRFIRAGMCVAAAVGAGVIGPATAGAAPNLIVNGSFEQPNIPPGFQILPSIPGWSHQARPGTTSSGIEVQDHTAGLPAAGAGDQFVELDSNGPSRIFQDVATSPGSTYRLSFIWSPRPNTAAAENNFRATAGPASAVFGPLAGGPQTSWAGGSLSFVATSASSRIEFLDLGPEQAGGGGVGAYVDLVVVELTNSPPGCGAVAPSPATLWPPNHKLRTVTLSGATDPDGDPVAITMSGVTQNEPVDGRGDGRISPDVVMGPGPGQVRLRAERSGRGGGRVYTIAFVAKDPSGASCSGTTTVTVRHDRR